MQHTVSERYFLFLNKLEMGGLCEAFCGVVRSHDSSLCLRTSPNMMNKTGFKVEKKVKYLILSYFKTITLKYRMK